MAKFTEEDLIENKELREEHLARIEVLNKVKEIITLSNSKVLSTKMVADYYEVPEVTIKKVYTRNKEELTANGALILRGEDLKEFKGWIHDVSTIKSASVLTVFSTRAVLNVGMLLTESPIAKEVRNQILNGYEQLTEGQRVTLIEEEKDLVFQIYSATDDTERMLAVSKLNNFKNRHIEKLNETIEEQKPKVESFDTFIDSKGFQRMNDVAKALGVGRNKLFAFLREKEVLMKDNLPYQKFINQDYFVVKESWYGKGERQVLNTQTFVTAKGVNWISKLLTNDYCDKKLNINTQ